MPRNYKREYANYQGSTEQKKRRAMRNKARRIMMRKGLVRKGDGKDVDHLDNNAMNSVPGNLKVVSKSANRSFPRTRKGRHRPGTH